jgi:hypothetical protein
MNVASPSTALSRAVDAHGARPYVPGVRNPRLTQDDARMLDRLQTSKLAQKAFEELRLDEAKWPIFIGDCVVAHRYANGMHAEEVEIFRSAADAADPDKARAALVEVVSFFRGSIFETIHDGPDPGPIGEAIALLAQTIDREERYRKEYRPSQKSGVGAAKARAIGHLRASVLRLTGIPNLKLVAAIVDAVLGLKDFTTTADDVKNAITPSQFLASRRAPLYGKEYIFREIDT